MERIPSFLFPLSLLELQFVKKNEHKIKNPQINVLFISFSNHLPIPRDNNFGVKSSQKMVLIPAF
jgi:hypothetical protein